MQNTTIESPRKRPTGVTIIAILLGIEGILAIIFGILILTTSFLISHRVTVNGHAVVATAVNVVGGFLGGFPLIIGILSLIFTWGLWMLKRWAFWATIVIAALNIVIVLPELFQAHPNIFSFIIRVIVPIIILLYFLLYPQVRHAFRM
ncbi:hypothetical protein KSF_012810 [Reticulibacter mediterranei]|uniref:DUF2127 domain-containing protein n=1 Tax=Reticulibacter mediterranei TaxID=2778369 RepID=A0A8J3ICY8_9CHLR|nr:hypothetical protein [Reticulibacter mediterranei]GHO91233.1 hypothetical protein KSF_012810 [Reticulibacter mediterranei]